MVMMNIIMTAPYKDDDVANGNGCIIHASTTYDACYKWGQTYIPWEQQQASRSGLF